MFDDDRPFAKGVEAKIFVLFNIDVGNSLLLLLLIKQSKYVELFVLLNKLFDDVAVFIISKQIHK